MVKSALWSSWMDSEVHAMQAATCRLATLSPRSSLFENTQPTRRHRTRTSTHVLFFCHTPVPVINTCDTSGFTLVFKSQPCDARTCALKCAAYTCARTSRAHSRITRIAIFERLIFSSKKSKMHGAVNLLLAVYCVVLPRYTFSTPIDNGVIGMCC
jgi:hypothetical protein